MRFSGAYRLVVGLAFAAISAPAGDALASCGDWLDHAVAGSRGSDYRVDRDQDPMPARPCRGPNCQRAPLPAAPSPAPVSAGAVEWVAMLQRSEALPADRIARLGEDAPGKQSSGFPSSIERPPRSS